MTTVTAQNVTVGFGRGRRRVTALDDVVLTLRQGARIGVVGESGSGKSTLANALFGQVPLMSGTVRLDGREIGLRRARDRAPLYRRLQMVFQNPFTSLDPRLRIGRSLGEALEHHDGDPATRPTTAAMLAQVGLPERIAGAYPHQLSGGQCQRVAIARALAAAPDILVADEPTTALDVTTQAAVLTLLRGLNRETGMGMLFISHNLPVVRYMTETVHVMYAGRIVESGPTTGVLAAPRHPYTRMLIDAVPALGGTPLAAPAKSAADAPPGSPGEGCAFAARCPLGPLHRPERTRCLRVRPQPSGGDTGHRTACHFPLTCNTAEEPVPMTANRETRL
ncbi:ABC transporter ATP-binding protein [Streptomyces sp. NPDC051018]|uniref:ABC transporter ATP-binding protein n=1 Tax=Streptomyces sp. NPDC051018 TaxID=3365639 RepID=UPI0037A4FA19